MRVELIAAPYDSGRRGERMGAGPEHLLAGGLVESLHGSGVEVGVHVLELPGDIWPAEIGSALHLAGSVATRVRAARAEGAFPIVLSGNCGPAALGVAAALGPGLGVVWFDAHGDFNTPDTTTTGFLDGMALATLCGRCWTRLTAAIPGFTPVAEESVALVGIRALDPAEARLIEESGVSTIAPGELREGVTRFLNAARAPTAVYVHVDLDVLDPAEGRANDYAAPGGLSMPDLLWTLESVARHAPIAAAAVTAYDPTADRSGRMAENARQIVGLLARCVAQQASS